MKPLVTIVCFAHNHRDFIRDAMDGFLMQETPFAVEIIMHDDHSTDGTSEIIRSYEKQHPGCLHGIYEARNRFSDSTMVWYDFLYSKIESKYIALCDGDDYWTNPNKLAKQIAILEADESLMACCTGCAVVDERKNPVRESMNVVPGNKSGRYSIREFILENHSWPTCTVVYHNRNGKAVFERAAKMENELMADWTMWVALLCEGDCFFLSDITAAYRINAASVTHTNVDERRMKQARMNFWLIPIVADLLPAGYEDVRNYLLNNKAWMWWKLANAYKHQHRYLRMFYCLIRWIF